MRIATLTLLLLIYQAAGAQVVPGDDLKAIGKGRVTGQYWCPGREERGADLEIQYGLDFVTEDGNGVSSLAVKGREVLGSELRAMNMALRGRSIESVTVSCSAARIRVLLGVLNYGSGEVEHVEALYWHRDNRFEVLP